MPSHLLTYTLRSSKAPVVRNPRACTVCRAAKVGSSSIARILWFTPSQMKCVGAEDGQKPCQRCKRTNAEYVGNDAILLDACYILHTSRCIFEKHRRGRKPGSKYD